MNISRRGAFGYELLLRFTKFLEDEEVPMSPVTLQDCALLTPTVAVMRSTQGLFANLVAEMKSSLKVDLSGKAWKGMLGSQIVEHGRFAFWFDTPDSGPTVVCCIYPTTAGFANTIDPSTTYPDGLPIVTVWLEASPSSGLQRTFRTDSLCNRLVEKGWRVVGDPARWAMIHKSVSLLELPATLPADQDDVQNRLIGFFIGCLRDLMDAELRLK